MFLAIFSIVQHSVDFPAVSSFVPTLVALFLPLSSLWATNTLDNKSASGSNRVVMRRVTPTYGNSSGKGKQVSLEDSTHNQSENGNPMVEHEKASQDDLV